MKKLLHSLPLLILILVLAFFLYPAESSPASPAAAPAAETVDTLNLVSSVSPSSAPASSGKESGQASQGSGTTAASAKDEELLPEDGSYTTKEDVALYLHQYGHLPSNFITKKEAREAGWPGGSLEEYFPGMCIGGDFFGNYEGLLPKAKGRTWKECDIDTLGKRARGPKRIIFSNDGLIYYTDDHYESYTQLY